MQGPDGQSSPSADALLDPTGEVATKAALSGRMFCDFKHAHAAVQANWAGDQTGLTNAAERQQADSDRHAFLGHFLGPLAMGELRKQLRELLGPQEQEQEQEALNLARQDVPPPPPPMYMYQLVLQDIESQY